MTEEKEILVTVDTDTQKTTKLPGVGELPEGMTQELFVEAMAERFKALGMTPEQVKNLSATRPKIGPKQKRDMEKEKRKKQAARVSKRRNRR